VAQTKKKTAKKAVKKVTKAVKKTVKKVIAKATKAVKAQAKAGAKTKMSTAPKTSAPQMKKFSSATVPSKMITPLDDRIIVAVEPAPETTAGGIIIPGSVNARPSRGTVMAKGRGRRNKKGVVRPLDVNIGDVVLFPEFAGQKIEMGSKEFLILREDEILAISIA